MDSLPLVLGGIALGVSALSVLGTLGLAYLVMSRTTSTVVVNVVPEMAMMVDADEDDEEEDEDDPPPWGGRFSEN